MKGTSHKTIGIGIAIACSYLGFIHGHPELCVTAITVPFGAMLPDIDHDRSKLGAARKKIVNTIRHVSLIGCVISFLVILLSQLLYTGFQIRALLSAFIIVIPVLISIILTTSDEMRKRISFLRKHRGIMHTLVPVVGMAYGSIVIRNSFIQLLIFGLMIGYVSHLLEDCQTVMGAPIFYPIIKKNISILKVRSGSKWENVVVVADLAILGLIVMRL